MKLRLTLIAALASATPAMAIEIPSAPERTAFSTPAHEVRLTLSPDGRTAMWFSRDRKGGAGGYDIWVARKAGETWGEPSPAPFNTPGRDFDPAFSADGDYVYFGSDRKGSLGGDDIWRVAVKGDGFGQPENLGPAVNSTANEWAPMLSPGNHTLLFSSDRAGGQGRQDLYVSAHSVDGFADARGLPGQVNTAADEFDATFLLDGRTIVFSRAPNLSQDRIDLFAVTPDDTGRYGPGVRLAEPVNDAAKDTYAPMLDWSQPGALLYSADRGSGMDLYRVAYRADAAAPLADDGGHGFDFLIGDWTVRLRQLEKPLTGSTAWVEYRGISRTHKVLDTNANFEEFAVTSVDGKKRKKGQTLRLFNPKTREWSIYLVDADNGLLPMPPVTGSFRNGVGEFYDQELWNGRTIFVRYQWSARGPNGAHMEQSFSPDGGRTWEANWIIDLTREAPR